MKTTLCESALCEDLLYVVVERLCGSVIRVFRMLILTWISGTVATFLEAISLSEQKGVAGNCQGSPRFHHVHDHVDDRHVQCS